ncbi:D-lyxose/D-mannose family sugar isomerase [Pelagibacterium montanilacus]|uniref:D-lyxose/D-mannose family sugar isomerase n=1 Tax=Pelagibacterium montanilacus TaxID=2185280 RepID=UPI000F8DCEB1|nr:D-lyxose/D-mannose family sugar isomerase [Pelagibacterium montanilacus]
MKRSQVNEIIRQADAFIRSFGYVMPPFAYWSPSQMKDRKADIGNIIRSGMGWDVTDYGQGDFEKLGLFLFTVRNGDAADLDKGRGMLYAEKIMISRHDQISPMHRHTIKAEDIINRGGAKLALQLYNDDGTNESIDETSDVVVHTDGIRRVLPAGGILELEPGESVTLLPGNWHKFWGEGGDVLIGEVSTVNDDRTDNTFLEPIGRFSDIEENEDPVHLLVSDYPKWFGTGGGSGY